MFPGMDEQRVYEVDGVRFIVEPGEPVRIATTASSFFPLTPLLRRLLVETSRDELCAALKKLQEREESF
jgi:hypothetical protein